VAVLVAVHLDLLYQELHQLAALFERFASVLFDLLDALSERQEPRLGGLCRQLVLFFATDIRLGVGKRTGPAGVSAPRDPAHRERIPTVDTTKSNAPAHPSTDQKPDDLLEAHYSCLERLEDDLRHADLGIEERCELEDRVLRLRRRLSR
jgi:hypothetical protein